MSFDWEEYLHLARHLAGQEISISEEAKLRAAISRAYYAAYNEALITAYRHGYSRGRFDPNHALLIRYYREKPYRDWRSIGSNLERIKDRRVEVDYKSSMDSRHIDRNLQWTTDVTISIAASIIETARRVR